MTRKRSTEGVTRRTVIKRATYLAPLVLTFPAWPSFAQAGSGGRVAGARPLSGGPQPAMPDRLRPRRLNPLD